MARGQITRQLATYRVKGLLEDAARAATASLSDRAEYIVGQAADVERKRTREHVEVVVLTFAVEPGDD
jgi:hypothetical protein